MTIKPEWALPIERGNKLYKYWMQRYNLFSRYDDGILLDEESWYSVTPENIAIHIAERIQSTMGNEILIVDGFCGVGGNLIQFACLSPDVRVIGCDISPEKIEMAKHNAKIYGVAHQCDFILGDFMEIMKTIQPQKVDVVFLSPPWGGIGYTEIEKYSLKLMTPSGYDIVHLCREHLTNNIAFMMPRNVDLRELRKQLLNKNHPLIEYEHNMVGTKIKTITVYFGDLVDQSSETDTEC